MAARAVTLLLARHGQTADNAGGLILGQRDPELSEVGRRQAARLAVRAAAAGVAALWCSPLLRARQTAEFVTAAIGSEPTVLDDLIESARGEWEGVPARRLAERGPALFEAFERGDPEFAFPGGESLRSQIERTRLALDVVAAGPVPALVIAHAGTIRAALLALNRDVPPERALPHGTLIPVGWRCG
jgi:broad specificity phosphatase PhoE